ncbi:MAG: hypothetical protein GWP08_17540 [Nitrospiraceae bacterium]|nr:hypothetical protein [Nitrospiraceae bacterium]
MQDGLREQHWTQQRRELRQWFQDRAPSFVEAYVGAVELLRMPRFPARVHFACHAVRDIYRYLPAALGVKVMSRPGEVFPNMVKELAKRWTAFPPSRLPDPQGADLGYSLAPHVYEYAEKIVDRSRAMGGQPTVGGQLAMALSRSQDRPDDDFIPPWVIKRFDDEYGYFVGRAHVAQTVDKVPTDDGLAEHFEAFERAFHSLVGPYFSGKEELDAILQDTNAGSD